jgi:antitoxin component of MazEF toxin-antitoxin module
MSKSEIEIRKVQALTGERSLTLVLPKTYATELGIAKGNFLKCHIEDHKLVLEKAEI